MTATIDSHSLEKILLIPMSKATVEPMPKELAEIFFNLCFTENKGKTDGLYNLMKKQSWVLEAIEKRIDVLLTVKISKAVQILILTICEGSIGSCIMYLYYTQRWAKLNNRTHVGMEEFSWIFPNGYITEPELQRLWNLQKISGGNLIDNVEAAASIM